MVRSLAAAAEKIGDVLRLIGCDRQPDQPAGAQRDDRGGAAGEAGRGFCRRRLRGQGTRQSDRKGNEEIAGQVTAIQSATGDCVLAIDGISATIREISGVATTIASAVEEQGSATREIARSVQTVAAAPAKFRANVAGASDGRRPVARPGDNVLVASGDLSQHATALFKSVRYLPCGLRNAAWRHAPPPAPRARVLVWSAQLHGRKIRTGGDDGYDKATEKKSAGKNNAAKATRAGFRIRGRCGFQRLSETDQGKITALRRLIFDTAKTTKGVGALQET